MFSVKFFGIGYYYHTVIVLETIVVLIEAYIYNKLCDFKIPKALLISFSLNSISYLCGLIIYN